MKLRLCLLALLAPLAPARAVDVVIEYENPSDSFFTATAQATIAKAAADVSFAITTTLAASQEIYTGTNLSTTAEADWSLSYLDPETGASNSLPTFSLGANQFRIYVGSRALSGSTLGVGGPNGVGVGLSGSGFEAQWNGAVANMETLSDAGMLRGGPRLGTISGSFSFGAANPSYNLDYGYLAGSLAIDNTELWNLDYNVLPTAGQNDLYSVAVHEMLHSIGFGTGGTWDDLATGDDWAGANAISLLGTGTNVLNAGGDHVASGLQGTPLVNGVFQTGNLQNAVMTSSITVGTRKYITDLDLAFLKDMGWQTVAVPEPSVSLLLVSGVLWLTVRRVRGSKAGV